MAGGLAIALAATVAVGMANRRELEGQLAAAEARRVVATRSLNVCEATSATLKNALIVAETGARAAAAPSGGLSSEQLLARQAAGADACARAFEAEALVREAAR